MRSKINFEKSGIIIVFLIIIINIIFRIDELAIISGALVLIILLVLCQSSVIKENNMQNKQLTPSPNGEQCIGNGLSPDTECMCDECEYFLECYPDWNNENKEYVCHGDTRIHKKGEL